MPILRRADRRVQVVPQFAAHRLPAISQARIISSSDWRRNIMPIPSRRFLCFAGRQHLLLATRLGVANGFDIVEHHQSGGLGIKSDAGPLRNHRHLQGHHLAGSAHVLLRSSRST
jgi:hypothetical protein